MKHVSDLWFETVSKPFGKGKGYALTHVLVVVTDLLTDAGPVDTGAIDDLDHYLRDKYPVAEEIRFVPKRLPKSKRPSKEVAEFRAALGRIGTIRTKRDPEKTRAKFAELGRKLT